VRRFILYLRLFMVALAAAVRRLFLGPKRPGWTFRFEVLVAVQSLANAGDPQAERAVVARVAQVVAAALPS